MATFETNSSLDNNSVKGTSMGRTDSPGFSWASKQLLIDTLEASAATAAFREATAAKFLESVRNDASIQRAVEPEKEILSRFLDFLEPRTPNGTDIEPVNLAEFRTFLEHLRASNAEAALNAKSNYHSRYLIVFVGPDKVGVLAELTRRLTGLGCVLEGATMVVVAGLVATMLAVSGPNTLAEEHINTALAGLPGTLFPDNPRVAAPPHVAPVQLRESGWPRRGSRSWHLYAEVADRPGTLARITEVIASYNVPLTSFATWLSKDRSCVLDLNYAVQPGVDGDMLAVDVREALLQLGAAVVRLYPSPRPIHNRADLFSPPKVGRAMVVTVLGRAEPGLVAAVTKGLSDARAPRSRFNIVGSAMAILQGHTAMALVIENEHPLNDSLLLEARQAASRYVTPDRFDAVVQSVVPLASLPERKSPPTKPTHQLQCVAPEQGGVLAAVAETLAEVGVNILWVMARVVEHPANGSHASVSEVRLDLAIPSRRGAKVSESIAQLRGSTGWQIELYEWGSVRDD